MHNMLWRARTSTLRSPNSKGVPSVMRRGMKDLPAHQIRVQSASQYDRQLGSMAGARWPRQRADTHTMHPISANRCDELRRYAVTGCRLAVITRKQHRRCVHAVTMRVIVACPRSSAR